MISCTVSFKLNLMKCVKVHGNRTTKRHFGVHQPQNYAWRTKEEELKEAHCKSEGQGNRL